MRGIGSSGGGRFDLLYPFRRKPRHDVEQFRFLYATLLELIEPPPPPSSPPHSPSLRPVASPAVDDNVKDDEAREQQQQQQAPAEGSSQEAAVLIDNNDVGGDDPCRYTSDGKLRRLRVRRRPTTKSSFPSPAKAKPYTLTEESAWRVLAATPNPSKEGNCADTALAVRDDESVAVLAAARAKESKVVDIICQIGETITHACDDEVWAYFCDKNILSLLVDITKATSPEESGDSVFCGVAFSPKVKAQVLQTLTAILSNADGDDTSLYFLLSSNHINETVSFFVPLHQWTLHALEEMLPHFCILLRNLTLRLLDKPQLVQFFVGDNHEVSTAKQQCCFPLFHSAVHVLSSTFAQSDTFVYETALGVMLNKLQIPSEAIRSAIAGAVRDQDVLLSHLCQRLIASYRHIARLTVGVSSGDPARSKAIGRELAHLHELFQVINDVLWAGIRPLNVRFCEYLLRVQFEHILPNLLLYDHKDIGTDATSSNEDSGEIPPDDPLICEEEAHCIASLVFLHQLFLTLEYAPLLKMFAVALFHPLSPKDIHVSAKETQNGSDLESDNFVLQSELNSILNNSTAATDKATSNDHENSFRAVLHAMIRGDRGYRRFVPAAILLQGLLDSPLEVSFLSTLKIVDKPDATEEDRNEGQYSEFQGGIGHFLLRNQRPSETASIALECAGALSLSFISHLIVTWTNNGTNFEHFHSRFASSPLVTAIATARSQYAAKAKTMSKAAELSDIFIELAELELSRRYLTVPGENDTKVFVCDLNANDCHHFQSNPEILVRTLRDPGSNEVEDAKFTIRALFYLRSLGRVLVETDQNLSSCIGPHSIGSRWTEDSFFEVRTSEVMEDDYIELVGREERPQLGTELDIRGRTFFYCIPSLPDTNSNYSSSSDQKRRLSQDLMRMTLSGQQEELLLVLDPTDLFVLKPNLSNGACNRGVILCHAPIGAVIAAVPERELLHIAIRQTEESFFVKNGNMSLKFDSIGTSRIAEQYLGRCRSALSAKKMANIESILNSCLEDDLFPSTELTRNT